MAIDNNTDIINIIAFDVGDKKHPESIEVDGYNGNPRAYDQS